MVFSLVQSSPKHPFMIYPGDIGCVKALRPVPSNPSHSTWPSPFKNERGFAQVEIAAVGWNGRAQ